MLKRINVIIFTFVISCLTSYTYSFEPIGNEILLIINYNHAYYDSIPFLKEIYSPYFPHIVFDGPQYHPEVEYCDHHKGYFAYKILKTIMQKYPNYKGYLMVHDDCVIHPWNFKRFDQTKIWFSTTNKKSLTPDPIKGLIYFPCPYNLPDRWNWWDMQIGFQAIAKAYNNFPTKNRLILSLNCENENTILFGFSDVVYIPAKFKDDVIELCTILEQSNAFLEIAMPTLCGCLDHIKNWEIFNGTNMKPISYYSVDLDYYHAMKFSNLGKRQLVKNVFEQKLATSKR